MKKTRKAAGKASLDPLVLLIAVHDYMEAAMIGPHPDAPGHSHNVPGKWDKDGTPCEWCATWNAVRELVKQNVPVSGGAKRRSAPVACSARYPVFTIPQIRHYLTGGIFTQDDDPDGTHLSENTALRALIAELEDREDGIEAVTARTEWREQNTISDKFKRNKG